MTLLELDFKSDIPLKSKAMRHLVKKYLIASKVV